MPSQALRGPILAQQNDALACAGCAFSKMSSRLRGVSIFTITRKKPHFGEPPASFDDVLSWLDAALACAGCTFLPKMLVSPQRRAHSTYPHLVPLSNRISFGPWTLTLVSHRRLAHASIRTSFGPWTVKRTQDLNRPPDGSLTYADQGPLDGPRPSMGQGSLEDP